MHREEDGYDFVVFDHLHIASILLEELKNVCTSEHIDFLFNVWKSYCELIDQEEYVETFRDVSLEGFFSQGFVNLDQC